MVGCGLAYLQMVKCEHQCFRVVFFTSERIINICRGVALAANPAFILLCADLFPRHRTIISKLYCDTNADCLERVTPAVSLCE